MTKINCLTRKAYKAALQIPLSTSTARFERLRVHNTAQQLVEAHHINQLRRLSTTPTGQHALMRLGIGACSELAIPIPRSIRDSLRVRTIPRNMHPTSHRGRREQRARALTKKLPIKPDILYVDVAEYRHLDAFALAVVDSPNDPPVNFLTVRTTIPAAAEEAAIALALTARPSPTITITDPKAAIQNFACGYISPTASKILLQSSPTSLVDIV